MANTVDTCHPDYEAALQVARETGDRKWEGNMLCNLGFLQLTLGRPGDARGHARRNEGSLASGQGEEHEARECYHKAHEHEPDNPYYLAGMLGDQQQRAAWSRNGLAFAETADLYSMPQHAADVILAEPKR